MSNKKIIIIILVMLSIFNSCKKDKEDNTPVPVSVSPSEMLNDFAYVIANPNYNDLLDKSNALNNSIIQLNASTTQSNLVSAQDAWRAVRIPWEKAEAFLFGPAEDFNYDPATDTWPVNTTELDSLLSSNNPLHLENVDSLQYSLKGYHPIEYLLFGVGGTRTASQLTPRELQYMVSLGQSLYNITEELKMSWDTSQTGNFTQELITAGNGSTRYATRKDALLTITNALIGICTEVADNKMAVPLAQLDSQLVESQYAHNATTDFINNIKGVQNVYMGRYINSGRSLHDMVAAKEASLDNQLQSQINITITSLESIDDNFGMAIFTQQAEIQEARTHLTNLVGILNQLDNFVQTNVQE